MNLASRLEGLNKFYGTIIMASEATMAACGAGVEFRELDLVAVKGKEKPVRVFEVMALKGELSPAAASRRQAFAQGLDLYRQGNFHGAVACLSTVLETDPEDGPALTFMNRCRRFLDDPTLPRDPVFRPDSK